MSASNLSPDIPAGKQIRRRATAALTGFAYFLMAVAALYFLNPEYTLVRSFTAGGNYAIGPHEFLIASTYFGLGLGSLALVSGLYRGMPRSVRTWIGLLLLGMWGAGILVAGIFPTDNPGGTVPHMTTVLIAGLFPVQVEGHPETTFGFIHILANLGAFFSLSLAAVLLSWRSRTADVRPSFQRLALVLALVLLAAFIWLLLVIFYVVGARFAGLSVGIIVVTGLTWLFLTAARLRFGTGGG